MNSDRKKIHGKYDKIFFHGRLMTKKSGSNWVALFGVCLLAFTAFLDATIVNTALPFIQVALHTDILQLQWVANIFSIILAMTMIAIGKFADLFGKKRVFYFGVVIFWISAYGAGASKSVETLIFFRGLQALGASIVFITSAALLSDVFAQKMRIRAISIYGGVTGFGLMIGPFLGGILVDLLDWRWVFWINIPIIAIGLAICLLSMKSVSSESSSIKIDWKGLVLLIFGLGCLMYGIIGGAQENWRSIIAWALLAMGTLGLIFLIAVDNTRKSPLLDLPLFKDKLLVLAALSCALAGVSSSVYMFFDPLYLRFLRDLSPFMIGVLIAIIPAAQAIISFVFEKSVKWFGVANLLFYSVVAAFLAACLHRSIGMYTPLLFLVLPFFLLGINWGLSNSAMITAVNQTVPSQKIGQALGTIATIWNISAAIILAISTAIFYAIEEKGSFLTAYHGAIDFNIAFAAALLAFSIFVRLKIKAKQRS